MSQSVDNPVSVPLETAAAPHLVDRAVTTRRMMYDVLIGLVPAVLAAVWVFRQYAVAQVAVCLVTALLTEALLQRLRGRPATLADGSVAITAVILALSLPPRLPFYASVVGTFVAVALGKMAFGGLGCNVFNPAMVGRAFLMICFPALMTTWAQPFTVDATTAATPLAAAKFSHQIVALKSLAVGGVSGSLGETSGLAIVVGGLWLLLRRSADWRLTAGMLATAAAVAAVQAWLTDQPVLGVAGHLCAGGMLLGAFFIVTDPVTSPITRSGRWIFGCAVGLVTMVIRLFAGYPEGVMFAVLVCNAFVPLLNRWTIPRPVGGHVPSG